MSMRVGASKWPQSGGHARVGRPGGREVSRLVAACKWQPQSVGEVGLDEWSHASGNVLGERGGTGRCSPPLVAVCKWQHPSGERQARLVAAREWRLPSEEAGYHGERPPASGGTRVGRGAGGGRVQPTASGCLRVAAPKWGEASTASGRPRVAAPKRGGK